ncbi:MAG: hypothetical protein ABJB12_18855 [Pseudomonadota bacterium]
MQRPRAWAFPIALAASLLVLQHCSEHVEIGRDLPVVSAGGGNAGLAAAATGGGLVTSGSGGDSANVGGSTATHACQKAACQGKTYLCGDCIDNDGDGLIDSDDPECTGPCDNTEDSYFGGIPGQNNSPCRQDCYFDQDTGSGNDQCFWSQDCDPLSVAPAYPPSGDSHCGYKPDTVVPGSGATCAQLGAAQSATCASYCGPITPNGCDSFGCCELPADSGKFVWIGSNAQNVGTCDAAHVNDPSACHPCTPVMATFNKCDPCEVCVGRTAPLAGCTAPASNRCEDALAACGQPGELACPADTYCITGCCVPAPR